MVVLKKHILEDGYEYLDPHELFDESDKKTFKLYSLAKACADVLMYYIENTPDAFGNAPYARLDGFMNGYLIGAGLEINYKKTEWDIVKGKRIILRIEVPQLPRSYYEAVKENRKTLREVFG